MDPIEGLPPYVDTCVHALHCVKILRINGSPYGLGGALGVHVKIVAVLFHLPYGALYGCPKSRAYSKGSMYGLGVRIYGLLKKAALSLRLFTPSA